MTLARTEDLIPAFTAIDARLDGHDTGKVGTAALAASGGAALVGFTSALTGSTTRTMQDKGRDVVSAADIGAVTTANINLATEATATASSALWRAVHVPNGNHTVGAGDASIYVRKGQSLTGEGLGASTLDASAATANTAPLIVMGKKSDGTSDAGGQAVEVTNLTILGGPDSFGAIAVNQAGYKIRDVFFTGPGVGVAMGGGDGLISGCYFDLGLNHIVAADAANAIVSGNIFYLGRYHITLGTDTRDICFTGNQHEYFEYAGFLLPDGATGVRNVQISDCNFIQNEQFATTLGAIHIRSSGADLFVSNSRFRNIKGSAISYGTGLLNKLTVEGCVFDGLKTHSSYAQSTTMGGIDASNTAAVIRGCSFKNLPGQPITLGGGEATTWIIDGCDFSGNTGGTTEINITNTNAASKVIVRNCQGSGRALINRQTTVPVFYDDSNDDGTGRVLVNAAATVTLPYGAAVATVLGSTTISSITTDLSTADRMITLWFTEGTTVENGTGNIRLAGAANFTPTILDTLCLVSVDGTWYEVSRSVN